MPAEKIGEEKEGRRRRVPLVQRAKAEAPKPPAPIERGMAAPKGRATPSRRRMEDEEDESGNIVTRTGGGLAEYLDGVRSELKKVAWPTRDELIRLTIIVLATLIASALVLGIISAAFTELFRIGLNAPIILIAVLVVAVGAGFVVYRVNSRRASY